MLKLKRFFLDWNTDLVSAVVEELTRFWRGGNLDLREELIVVPTRTAARRLRERLAEQASLRESVVIPGPVVIPEYFIEDRQNRFSAATDSLVMAVWVKLLEEVSLDDYPALFPRPDSTAVNRQWALDMAEKLINVKRELGEAALTIKEAGERLSDSPEQGRWQELARLESEYQRRLKDLGMDDPDMVKNELVSDPRLPERIKKVSVFAVPDPLQLAVIALENIARTLPVEVYVYAPPEHSDAFDNYGRPRIEYWQDSRLEIPDFHENVIMATDPADQARKVAGLLRTADVTADSVAAGVPDPEVVPHLEYELEEAGFSGFNPAGDSLADYPLVTLIQYFKDIVIEDDYNSCRELLRHPDVLSYAEANLSAFNVQELLSSLDQFHNQHLPASVSDLKILLQRHVKADEGATGETLLGHLYKLVDSIYSYCRDARENGEKSINSLLSFLRNIYGWRELSFQRREDTEFADAAAQVAECARDLQTEILAEINLEPEVILTIFHRLLRKKRAFPERSLESVDLQGWLELLWDDSPVLIVTGMNDGRVPETMVGDVFLPDSARVQLELRNNRQRFARDAYILTSLIESRRDEGRVILLSGKTAEGNEPLKPSRLFFLCDDEAMVERAEYLFAEAGEPQPVSGTATEWSFQLPVKKSPQRLAVTALNSFLECPFRFYLKYILGMETLDDRKLELEAIDFGNIIHKALEVLRSNSLRDCTDKKFLCGKVGESLDMQIRERYGSNLTAPMMVQLESARQRLYAALDEHIRLIEEGWRVRETEKQVKLNIAGIVLHGRIDRIDEAPDGRLRILDYKTSEKAKDPAYDLWGAPVKSEENDVYRLDYALVKTPAGKEKQWKDIQLPLYKHILQQEFPDSEIECGYFNLPRAVTETGVKIWETPASEADYIAAAVECAGAVIEDIKEGRFWPPAKRVPYDDFATLFLENPSHTFIPSTAESGLERGRIE